MLGNRPAYSVDKLPDGEATALLREHYAALADADAANLVKLCAGMPLALRIAGAHLSSDAAKRGGVADVAGYLKKLRTGRLGTLDADASDVALASITGTLRLSEAQYPEPERDVWRKLGVFTASFDERAAKVIAGAEGIMLDYFVRRSLLEREGDDRYKLHDLAADYARAQLNNTVRDDLRLAHAQHYCDVLREANELYLKGGDSALRGLSLFDIERVNVETGQAFVASHLLEFEAAGKICTSYGTDAKSVLRLRLHFRRQLEWLEAALRSAQRTGDRNREAQAVGEMGVAYKNLGDAKTAIPLLNQQLVICQELGIKQGQGTALCNLGIAYRNMGNARKAIVFYEQALVIAREINDRRLEGVVLGSLGLAHADLGNARKAIEFCEQALVIAREIGDRRGEGQALCDLGLAHGNLGDGRKAIEFCEQALVIFREIGDRRGEGYAVFNFALAHDKLGNHGEAVVRAAAALVILEAIEDANAAKVRTMLAKWRGQA